MGLAMIAACLSVMIEPTDYGQNEGELPCAFSLPAVAQSLGAERWGELNSVFTQLQRSNQWQVPMHSTLFQGRPAYALLGTKDTRLLHTRSRGDTRPSGT